MTACIIIQAMQDKAARYLETSIKIEGMVDYKWGLNYWMLWNYQWSEKCSRDLLRIDHATQYISLKRWLKSWLGTILHKLFIQTSAFKHSKNSSQRLLGKFKKIEGLKEIGWGREKTEIKDSDSYWHGTTSRILQASLLLTQISTAFDIYI